jgi:hypothetical protein
MQVYLPNQPLSVGDLIGRAIRTWRANLLDIFKILLPPTIVYCLGMMGFQLVFVYAIGELKAPNQWQLLIMAVPIGLICFIIALLGQWFLTLRQLALVRMVTGFATDYQSALSAIKREQASIFGLFCLNVAGFITVIIAWFVFVIALIAISRLSSPMSLLGQLITLVSIPTATFCLSCIYILLFFSLCIVACEGKDCVNAIGRASELYQTAFWRICGFGFCLFVSITALSSTLNLPVALQSGWHGYNNMNLDSGAALTVPYLLTIGCLVWESLVNMILWPITYFSFAFVYYDLRLRNEGLDLARSIDSLAAPADHERPIS